MGCRKLELQQTPKQIQSAQAGMAQPSGAAQGLWDCGDLLWPAVLPGAPETTGRGWGLLGLMSKNSDYLLSTCFLPGIDLSIITFMFSSQQL